MAALLVAVDSTGVQVGITLAADHLVAVVLLGKLAEGGIDDASLQKKHQAQGGLFQDIVVRECGHPPAVCKNQTQVTWDALPVLGFSFDILSGVTGLDLEGDGLAYQSIHKDKLLCVCWGGCQPLTEEKELS